MSSRKWRPLHRFAALIGVAALATALSACGQASGEASNSGEQEGQHISLKWWLIPGTSQEWIPEYLESSGIAEKHGFDIELVKQTSTQPNTALRAKTADIAANGLLETMSAVGSGAIDAKVIATFTRFGNPIIASPDSDLSLKDLKGKTVGTFSDTQIDWNVLRGAMVKAHGFDLSSDSKVSIGAPGILNKFVEEGKVDAALQFSDLGFLPVAEGKVSVVGTVADAMKEAGWNTDNFDLVYDVRQGWIDDHPDALGELQKMIEEAKAALQNDDDIWNSFAKDMQIPDKYVADFIDAYRPVLAAPFDESLISDTQKMYDDLTSLLGKDAIGGVSEIDKSLFVFPEVS